MWVKLEQNWWIKTVPFLMPVQEGSTLYFVVKFVVSMTSKRTLQILLLQNTAYQQHNYGSLSLFCNVQLSSWLSIYLVCHSLLNFKITSRAVCLIFVYPNDTERVSIELLLVYFSVSFQSQWSMLKSCKVIGTSREKQIRKIRPREICRKKHYSLMSIIYIPSQ